MTMARKINTYSYQCQPANVFDLKNTPTYVWRMGIRENLAREMARRGWNAYDLEKASGVPQPTIHRALSGQHSDPRSSTIRKLAKGLGITESQLREGSGIDPPPICTAKLTPRHRALIDLFDALPPSDQDEVMHLVEDKERRIREVLAHYEARKKGEGGG